MNPLINVDVNCVQIMKTTTEITIVLNQTE